MALKKIKQSFERSESEVVPVPLLEVYMIIAGFSCRIVLLLITNLLIRASHNYRHLSHWSKDNYDHSLCRSIATPSGYIPSQEQLARVTWRILLWTISNYNLTSVILLAINQRFCSIGLCS